MDVDGDIGRGSSFEVVVNEKYLAWSKLEKRTFPEWTPLAEEVAAFAKSGVVPATWKAV